VAARPDPALARLARWGRKHRTAVASLVALLATGLVTTSVGLILVNQQRDRAIKAEGEAKSNLARAEEGERQAKQSESEARAVLSFFQDKVLAAGRPEGQEGGLGRNVTLREAVDAAESSIATDFADQPTVEASIRNTLGNTYDWRFANRPLRPLK
jgi:eukaryotic-like serine/threonine-protein kinase